MRGSRRFFGLVLLAASGLIQAVKVSPAHALETSELEERSIARALGPHPAREEEPEGKRIERLDIVRLPVFDDDDPVPDFVNMFHWQTRESTLRRELLLQAGDDYRHALAEETVRNLQTLPQFGVVLVVALKGSSVGSVRVVVIVRDVWSLRLSYELQGTLKSINYLVINPVETNLFGTRTQLGGVFALQPDRYTVGGALYHPRVLGTKVDVQAQGGVYVNLDRGKPEGSYGALVVRKDLFSLADRWAFLSGATWTYEQTRVYQDRQLLTVGDEKIPLDYATRIVRAGADVTRSYGTSIKVALTTGVELNRRSFGATRSADTSPRAFAEFVRAELPVSDTRFSPFFQLEQRSTQYLLTRDIETLALQESYWLGPQAAVRVYPALQSFGSSRDLLGTSSWVGYAARLGDGIARVVASSNIEAADQGRNQAFAQGGLRVVTPRLGFGRFVVDGAAVATYQNYLNRKFFLGGDTRPRGYISAQFRGASGAAASAELRTTSINILSARVGAVVFYDVGGTGERIESLELHQSAGAGVRILFPQLNRKVFRLDWAAPLTAGRGRFPDRPLPGGVFFTFDQAFEMPNFRLPQMLSREGTLLEPTL